MEHRSHPTERGLVKICIEPQDDEAMSSRVADGFPTVVERIEDGPTRKALFTLAADRVASAEAKQLWGELLSSCVGWEHVGPGRVAVAFATDVYPGWLTRLQRESETGLVVDLVSRMTSSYGVLIEPGDGVAQYCQSALLSSVSAPSTLRQIEPVEVASVSSSVAGSAVPS
jgi:hypothetical protein